MTPEQFWTGDVWLAADYNRAHQLSVQRASEEMWLQGLYNFGAISLAIGNAMRRKGTPAKEYPAEALRLIPFTEEEQAERIERERQKAVAYFTNLQKKWDRAKCRSAKCREEAPRHDGTG